MAAGHNGRARHAAELANAAIIDDRPALSRAAASAGLAALEDRGERPLVDAPSLLQACAVSGRGDRRGALELSRGIAAGVPDDAPWRACVLDALADAYCRNDETGPALTNPVRADTLAAAPGFEADRANAADALATMFQRRGCAALRKPFTPEELAAGPAARRAAPPGATAGAVAQSISWRAKYVISSAAVCAFSSRFAPAAWPPSITS